ncbi:MAG: hypothetical protein LBS56_06965 [Propionibacteriaceae bacterium]|nr:hypothetical protein [Propionibacteriaceae bacterium]
MDDPNPSVFTIGPFELDEIGGSDVPDPGSLAWRRLDLAHVFPDGPTMVAVAVAEPDGEGARWLVGGPAEPIAWVPVASRSEEALDEALAAWAATFTPVGGAALTLAAHGEMDDDDGAVHVLTLLPLAGISLHRAKGQSDEDWLDGLADAVAAAAAAEGHDAEDAWFDLQEVDGKPHLVGHLAVWDEVELDAMNAIREATLQAFRAFTPFRRVEERLLVVRESDSEDDDLDVDGSPYASPADGG